MAEGLPKGLITTNAAVKGSIESVDRVDVKDIARLWKGTLSNGQGPLLSWHPC